MSFKFSASLLACFCLAAGAQETDIRRDATVNAVEQVMPTVVNIATKVKVQVRNPLEQMRRQMWGQPLFDEFISQGSGVVIDENGYLLTNEHVIENADRIQVRFGTTTLSILLKGSLFLSCKAHILQSGSNSRGSRGCPVRSTSHNRLRRASCDRQNGRRLAIDDDT